jgi:hypothetical protein
LDDDDEETRNPVLISQSDLAPPGWEDIAMYTRDALELTRRALTVLVALLYGARLDCQLLARQFFWHEDKALITTVCATAEFWGCLELIKPRILSVLKSSPVYWRYVGE